jgi:hypothetical protein
VAVAVFILLTLQVEDQEDLAAVPVEVAPELTVLAAVEAEAHNNTLPHQ